MRGCRAARRRFDGALDGELALEERFRLEAHLAACPVCAQRFAELRRVEEAFQRLPEPPLERLDLDAAVDGVRAGLAAAARSAGAPEHVPPAAGPRPLHRPRHRARHRNRRVGSLVLLAAALAAALGLALELGSGRAGGPAETTGRDVAGRPAQDEPHREEAPAEALPGSTEGSTAGSIDESMDEATRLAALRERMREALAIAFAGVAPGGPAAGPVARFEELLGDAGRGWSLRRNVEVLVLDPEPLVARGALRYLGLRGDVLSRQALEPALAVPGLRASAVAALADLGPLGVPALARALQAEPLPADAVLALGRLARGMPEAARALEDEVRRRASLARRDEAAQALLVETLAGVGPRAVDGLLRLVRDVPQAAGELLSALALVPGGRGRILELLERRVPAGERDALLEGLAVLQPPEALPWLAEEAEDPRGRAGALRTLGSWADATVLPTLLALVADGRVPEEQVVAITRPVLSRDPAGAVRLAEATLAAEDEPAGQQLAQLLLAAAHPAGGEALAVLALGDLLVEGERVWCALAVGELGDPAGAARLARELPGRLDADRRLLAACLVSIHAVGGRAEARRLLERIHLGDADRLVAALEEQDQGSLGLNQVARELARRLQPKEPRSSTP